MFLAIAFAALAWSLPTDDTWEEATAVVTDEQSGTEPCTPKLKEVLKVCGNKHLPAKDKQAASCDAARKACGWAKAKASKVVAKVHTAHTISKGNLADNMGCDAGSGGTKMMVFENGDTAKGNANIDSECATKTATSFTSKGLAMLAYPPSECQERIQLWSPRATKVLHGQTGATIEKYFHDDRALSKYTKVHKRIEAADKENNVPGLNCDSGTPQSCVTKYRTFTLDGMTSFYKSTHLGKTAPAKNHDRIPMVATAGMRLKSQPENTLIWSGICGSPANGPNSDNYNFATEASGQCGTISGSTEGFYEYLSFKRKVPNSGTFTVGGASAQLAIPLKKTAAKGKVSEKDSFVGLMTKIAKENLIQCDKMFLDGKGPPVAPKFEGKQGFNRLKKLTGLKTLDEDKHGCITDYIDLKNDNGSPVGTVSFLNLRGPASAGVPIAGGAEEMYNWAKATCASDNVMSCLGKLTAELNHDLFWKAVTDWFQQSEFTVDHFAYATENANAQLGTDSKIEDFDARVGSTTATVGSLCQPFTTHNFDWNGTPEKKKDSEECIKAVWANFYLHSFFKKNDAKHPDTQVALGPNTDWVGGLPGLAGLLQINAESQVSSFNYMEGLVAAMENREKTNKMSFEELDQNKDGMIDFDEFSFRGN